MQLYRGILIRKYRKSMRYFCTYFDSGYLVKGLALYRSLVRFASPFRLWVLCFDDLTYKTLQDLKLDEVVLISLKDFETGDEELLQAKANRSRIEYYFTCTPSLPLYVLKNYPKIDLITYVDADLFFFSDPSPIYEELGNNSILIIGHRFPSNLKHLEATGIYNVGFLSFRNDDIALQCLHWWRERCIEWCYDRLEDGRYADQKYLDDWPNRFSGVVVLQHKGANLAPWNVANYSLELDKGKVLIDSEPIVFFHFHALRKTRWLFWNPTLSNYEVRTDSLLKTFIYSPYIQELYQINRGISRLFKSSNIQMHWNRASRPGMLNSNSIFCIVTRKSKNLFALTKKVLKGELWVVVRGRVL